MALFQPSNILPDARSGLGQGTVDATQPLTVSWQVNGSSALTGFRITVFQMDAASTQVFTTGKRTDGCPFYGTTPDGDIQRFSYTIPASALSAAGVVNGSEYKLIIQQWWNATDSVTQSSASAFLTRDTPSLSIPAIGTIDTRYYTFSANYAQAQGDSLNWFRWRIAAADDTDAPFFDSGNISGTMQIQAYYDGFFTGTDYAVRCSVQTENGVEADTGWVTFSVSYDSEPVTGAITASCAQGTNAVLVDITGVGYIPGEAVGDYSIDDEDILTLASGAYVTWQNINFYPISFAAPWSVIYKGTPAESTTLFSIGQSGGDISLVFDVYAQTLVLQKGTTALATMSGVINFPEITAILTPETLYVRARYLGGGLYPSETLYPSQTLYPKANTGSVVDRAEFSVSYTQESITYVRVYGMASVDYIEVIKGSPSSATIQDAWQNGSYVPGLSEIDYMVADFANGLNAGNLNIGADTIIGYDIYRIGYDIYGEEGTVLNYVGEIGANETQLLDYSARSGQGPYTYYVFPIGKTSYIATPIPSNPVSPCFWDWSLMECQETEREDVYTVLAEYRFGKNLTSGAMSNNNQPKISKNFTPYPTVQYAAQNYRSGSLKSLIGTVNHLGGYADTIALRDKIFALSVSQNTLFLKSRKGDLLRVAISGAISMQTGDNTRQQTQTVSLSWVETGSAEGVSLIAVKSAAV